MIACYNIKRHNLYRSPGAIWVNDYNPSHSGNTYNSQSTFLYPYTHADGHVTHIWMADRWNEWGPGSLQNMCDTRAPICGEEVDAAFTQLLVQDQHMAAAGAAVRSSACQCATGVAGAADAVQRVRPHAAVRDERQRQRDARGFGSVCNAAAGEPGRW